MTASCIAIKKFLFCSRRTTNNPRLFGGTNASPYVKDGINDYVVAGKQDAVNPEHTGTKVSPQYHITVGAGQTTSIYLRLSDEAPAAMKDPFGSQFGQIMQSRRQEADAFYRAITPERATEDAARVMRQALAGMLWSKQYFYFDLDKWLTEHGENPLKPNQRTMRNGEWFRMVNQHIISMPDKWEYPWYAAWDLAVSMP